MNLCHPPETEALAQAYASSPTDLGQLVRNRWGGGRDPIALDNDNAIASLIDLVKTGDELFAGKVRNNRPDEPLLIHSLRVGDTVYKLSKGNLLCTFMAVAHDFCEDSLKFRPQQPIAPEDVANLWRGGDDEKKLIVAVLKLKTDDAALKGDARRAAQHIRVMQVNAGAHGEAGRIFALLVVADKKDNMEADYVDNRNKRLTFKNRDQALEWIFKKQADWQIVHALPVAAELKQDFAAIYTALMTEIVLHQKIPAHSVAEAEENRHYAAQLARAHTSNRLPVGNPARAREQHQAQSYLQQLAFDLRRLQGGHTRFGTRCEGLGYAFHRLARSLTVAASPTGTHVKMIYERLNDKMIANLLYAGSHGHSSVIADGGHFSSLRRRPQKLSSHRRSLQCKNGLF